MKKVKFSGLFRKYFLVTISIILASFAFIGVSLMVFVSGVWMDEKLNDLEDNTVSVANNTHDLLTSSYLGHNSTGTILMICNNLAQMSDAVDADIFVVNENGLVVYCKEMMTANNIYKEGKCLVHSNIVIPEEAMNDVREGKIYRDNNNLGGELAVQNFVVGCPINTNSGFHGAVFTTKPIATGLLPYVSMIFRMFAFATLATSVIVFILVSIITYKTTKPLREMSEAAKLYSSGDFSKRIKIRENKSKLRRTRTEVDELSESFNSMAQALSNLEMSRRDFVSNVSHELKTPMTTISGFIDGILDGTITPENEKKYLSIVSEEVKRLSRLVTGMLNMNKLEAGKLDINPVEFDISEMLFNTLLSFEQVIDKKTIDVIGLDSFTANAIFADKDMINQVIYNLVDNAVKFTPEGGYIEVHSKRDSEKAIIRIKNSGKGIAPEEIDKIFERFYKVDKSRSYDVKGAGMGLYIVKTIIELHGGYIEAHSEPDNYTEFVFTLPVS